MNEPMWGMVGVVIGGLIGSIMSGMQIYSEKSKWKKEKKIEILKVRKNELAGIYTNIKKSGLKVLSGDNHDSQALADLLTLCPKTVMEKYNKLGNDEEKKKRFAYADLLVEMNRSLADLDKKILSILD